MAIPLNTKLNITPQADLVLATQELLPLASALENVNWLWVNHKPPLVDVCPSTPSAMTRNTVIVVPIIPSADGIAYDFHTTISAGAALTLTVTVEYTASYTGLAASGTPTAWVNIFTQATAFGAGGRQVQVKLAQTVPTAAVALRWTLSVSASTYEAHHILALPGETTVATGLKTSGFLCYDTGLFGTVTGAPVHTELLNRCRRSATALLIDRKQMAFSFAQDEVQANYRVRSYNQSQYQNFQTVRVWFPNQGKTATLNMRALVSITGGAAATVKISQQGADGVTSPQSVTFTGTVAGAITTGDLLLTLQGTGLGRYADLILEWKTDGAFYTYLHSIVGIWKPEV